MGKYPSCDSCEAYKDKFCVDLKTGVRKFEPDPRLGCPDHKPVKLFRMHDHENRKSIWPNILDNNGIELDEKNPGSIGDWKPRGIFCKGENENQVLPKKPIPTEMFTVTKTGDANTSEHYKHFRIQPIDFVVANDMGFLEANVIKYICRYPYKGSALKDLEKARQYVDWLIERERKRTAEYFRKFNKQSDERWGGFDPSYLFDKEPDEVRTRNVAAIVTKFWDVWLGWIRLFFNL